MPEDEKTADMTLFEEFFSTLGADHEVSSSVTTVEEAIQLGSTIHEQPWFDPNRIQLGGIFQVTSVMIDMRDKDDPHWPLVHAFTENMPPAGDHSGDDPDSAPSVYANIKLNVDVVRNCEEDRSPAGIEKGHRILFREPRA
ncbi:MAG: hypothetical protein A2406_02690 [Candidatus Komeilibacteria bacterium RIFOXYC1_FULL_37_11]|uniref:Uncharacterized protein n=1 Tax=Candidatus Komeilibacteria bacterium RIFOXYC1_FULL_37_11 TaxID=1798555 RepID=A0A1G2C0H2_9BACT|nr:MAG: hypothetical protein A2406_02690 [Candidatus Komeilibacteria bacterium RIFOXYC1_FULL_37_11]OGY95439.1 MAG: hypothetical protein A2611_01935 [Candidatus Komeilibacteria bacterium RIFOXYD1_FULL_37_29]OGY96631.1 MAG: hypothetical protein A2543_02790 [Candidatus Komeilibacteria bacterium RIFOXYD2_FULL_37_8]